MGMIRVRGLHPGQLVILWAALAIVAVVSSGLGIVVMGFGRETRYHRDLAVADSLARDRHSRSELDDSVATWLNASSADYQIEGNFRRMGIQDTSFRAPSRTDVRFSYLQEAVAWVMFTVALATLPFALVITWFWFGGRTRRE